MSGPRGYPETWSLSMSADRVVALQVEGLRTLADITLDLHPLTVLIGETSTGKSSLLEAAALLARAARPDFYERLHDFHGGLRALLRQGARRLRLGVTLRGHREDATAQPSPDLRYSLSLSFEGIHAIIEGERLEFVGPHPSPPILSRTLSDTLYASESAGEWLMKPLRLRRDQVLLSAFGSRPPHEAIPRVIDALEAIEVHGPVDVLPLWMGAELGWESPLRASVPLQPAERLALKGSNLANLWYTLREGRPAEHLQNALSYVRLGLGEDVLDVKLPADPGGGAISLALEYRGFREPVPARGLSDGTLAWLAFVAMTQLGSRNGLLCFDEPESHLHPGLLRRVVSLFETLAEERSVLLATQSDALLDALDEPVRNVVVCTLDSERATRLQRLDHQALVRWLQRYRGLGEIRAAGHLASVLKEDKDDGGLRGMRRRHP